MVQMLSAFLLQWCHFCHLPYIFDLNAKMSDVCFSHLWFDNYYVNTWLEKEKNKKDIRKVTFDISFCV